MRARIKQAVRYPIFVMIAMAVAIVILNLFVIPVLPRCSLIQRPAAHYPRFARVFGVDDQVVAHALIVGAIVVWMGAGLRAHAPGPLPVTPATSAAAGGRHHPEGNLARFARSLRSPARVACLVQALTVVAQTVDNAFIGSRIEQMRDGIERGESISLALRHRRIHPGGAADD